MDVKNPLYENQGIHVEAATFTVEDGVVKVLLIKRKMEPFVGEWIIPGGAVRNNESAKNATLRELKEKTGLEGVHLKQFHAFTNPDRDPRKRMVAIGYLALIDKNKVEILQQTPKTLDSAWFDINNVPKLAFDHEKILKRALKELKTIIAKTNLVRTLLPENFTLSELQKIYEAIFEHNFDRRNFRRKFLSLGLIKPTGGQKEAKGHRPANYYKFIDEEFKEVDIF